MSDSYPQVFVTATTEKPSIFASDSWITIPFSVYPKSTFDKLVDILLQLPGCSASLNQMKALEIQNPRKSESIKTELRERVMLLVSRLDDWWQEYEEGSFSENDKGSIFQEIPSHKHSGAAHSNISTSPMTSLYHSANILAYRLLSLVSPPLNLYEQAIMSHSDHVLSAAKSLNSAGGQGALLMVFPLKVLCAVARDEQQKALGLEALEQLGKKRGLDGICKRATPVYIQRYQRTASQT